MMKWLARWFGAGATPPSADASLPVPEGSASDSQEQDGVMGVDLDLAFFHWLAGPFAAPGDAGGAPVLDELARLRADPGAAADLVPRVPAVIPQLLRSLRDEGSSSADLARQVAQDAVLVAELIREVNSPYYRPPTPVRNLEGALMLLGQNGLRMLLARVAFRPVISAQGGPMVRQLAPLLWSQSEKSAQAASMLAPAHGADPFEAYLAGLMHNIGLVVALRLADQLLAGALPDSDAFASTVLQSARALAARIAAHWEMPWAVADAIGSHEGALGQALAAGERLASLRLLADAAQPGFVRAAAALSPAERQVYDKLQNQDD